MDQRFVSPSPSVLLVVLKGCYRPFSHFPPVILLNIYLVIFISKFWLRDLSRPAARLFRTFFITLFMQFGKIFAKKLPFFQSGWQLPLTYFR